MTMVNYEFEGVSRVKYSDRENLHYTMSALTEIERVVLVGEATMAHEASQDVLVCGVRIPKGVMTYKCLTPSSITQLVQPVDNQFTLS